MLLEMILIIRDIQIDLPLIIYFMKMKIIIIFFIIGSHNVNGYDTSQIPDLVF